MNEGSWIDLGAGGSPPHVLSKTSAHLLLTRSPLHARLRKLRQAEEDDDETEDEKKTKETGTILHALLLRAGKKIVMLDYENFRTKAAQQAKKDVRESGAVPVLRHKEPIYTVAADRIRRRLEEMGIVLDGQSEQGMSWIETTTDGSGDTVECLGAADHWSHARRTLFDLKFCRNAHPEACRRELYRLGGDIQAAAYTSAVEKIHPELQGRTRFVFLYCEPYSAAVTPVTLSGDFRRLGEQRWQRAVNTWARCLREDRWPGYTTGPITIDAPEWAMAAEMTAQHDANEQSFQTGNHDEGDDDDE